MVVFVRIEDAAGRRYQTGNQTAISGLRDGEKYRQLDYKVSFFVTPGEYVVSFAVCDARTLEHSFTSQKMHVPGLRQEPLPGAWKGLPPIEFLPDEGAPDGWYLPQVRSRIALPVSTEGPVRIELLVNTTPSEPGSVESFRRNMELILPAMKVLMGIEPDKGSAGLSVIDLSRRTVSYREPDLRRFDWGGGRGRGSGDWAKLRPVFAEVRTSTVDAGTLAGERGMAEYFAREASVLGGGGGAGRGGGAEERGGQVLIVLSAPMYFGQQDAVRLPELPADPGRRVYYIGYSPMAILTQGSLDKPVGERPLYLFTDDLERVLKPMGARVLRVSKPEEFRRALATILDGIASIRSGPLE